MAEIIYLLCALTAALCTWRLLLAYKKTHYRLLLWGGLSFCILTLNNVILVLDKMVVTTDLTTWRLSTSLLAMTIFLYGLIWDTE